ncbi:N-acetylglutaminylglutamine synthetase [Seongchinamella unica]|nr:N-acetylglutaminylglutamine synthetase [Seongchinamella unica]
MRTEEMVSLKSWGPPAQVFSGDSRDAIVNLGWGRLLFGQTFDSAEDLVEELRSERDGTRDVALYIRDPQVLIAQAPQELFIDPSLTYRLSLEGALPSVSTPPGISVRPMTGIDELRQANGIYLARGMVPMEESFLDDINQRNDVIALVAVDEATGKVVGTVLGVDHRVAFGDPDNGASLWALAADAQRSIPGLGTALVLDLASRFGQRGRSLMDLSVMHDNNSAIQMYSDLGFEQVPVYCVKVRNAINEPLYTGPRADVELNPYAKIITDEAYRRGISVEIEDEQSGIFRLSLGGRVVHCRESLTDATSAVAVARCDDKALTHRLLEKAGLCVPAQAAPADENEAIQFLHTYGSIVIKPAQGEQGEGVAVALETEEQVREAFREATALGGKVIAEEFIEGLDLRVVVINDEVVAAAIRRPAGIIGTGRHTLGELIERQSRRRSAATDGESRIPVDDETLRCVAAAGFTLDSVIPAGEELAVRKTANLHTGGTLHDVTDQLHPRLKAAALRAARVLDIPVVGMDLMVRSAESSFYYIIEANERPGLANHEPQPTAARLIDFLFPTTVANGDAHA